MLLAVSFGWNGPQESCKMTHGNGSRHALRYRWFGRRSVKKETHDDEFKL